MRCMTMRRVKMMVLGYFGLTITSASNMKESNRVFICLFSLLTPAPGQHKISLDLRFNSNSPCPPGVVEGPLQSTSIYFVMGSYKLARQITHEQTTNWRQVVQATPKLEFILFSLHAYESPQGLTKRASSGQWC